MSIVIVISLLAGIMTGYFFMPQNSSIRIDVMTNISLIILVFSVGLDIGNNKIIFKDIVDKGFRILFIPLSIVIGTLIGGIISGLFFKYSINTSMAISSGFGWYSLSGIILTEIANAEIGTIAFLSNIFREITTILIVPVIAKKLNYITTIAPAGATSMDSTLPIISHETDQETVLISFVNGVVLSALVPILVPLLYGLSI